MHHLSSFHDTPSLDDVVQQAVQHHSSSGGGGASTSTPPSSALHAALTQLTDSNSSLSSELTRTPTVQALHKFCRTFVERYHTPDTLLLDTAWWASEAARLRGGEASSSNRPPQLPLSATLTTAEREELLLRTVRLLRATHQSKKPTEVYGGGNTVAAGGARHLDITAGGSLSSHPPHHDVGGDVNVLQFDDPPLMNEQEGNWESVELGGGTDLQRSGGMQGRVSQEGECLHVLETWIEDMLNGDGKAEDAKEHLEASRLESLEYLLHHRPELVTRHAELFTLQHLVAVSTCSNPSGHWAATAFTFFQALPARAQLDFLHHVIENLRDGRPRTEDSDVLLMTFVQQLLHEFPENWLPLLDSEVTGVFLGVVSCVVVPFAAVLGQVDAEAVWLAQWCMRPSFMLASDALIDTHPLVVRELLTEVASSSHAVCVLLHLLPAMCRRSDGGDGGAPAALTPAGGEATEAKEHEAHEPSWAAPFHALQHLLSESPPRFTRAVYELGSRTLCACATQLPPQAKERCITDLTDVLLQWPSQGKEDAVSAATAAAEAPFLFSFRLYTELLCETSEAEPWCPDSVWGSLDVPMRTQMQLAATAAAADSALHPRNAAEPSAFASETLEALQHCWSRILCCRASKLPHALAALVEDVAASCADVPDSPTRLFTWNTLIAVSSTLCGWSALQPHLPRLARGLSSCSSAGRWAPLLQAILEVSGSVALASVTPISRTHSRTPSSSRKSSASRSPRTPAYRHVDFLSPRCVALLLRWCTFAEARAGLVVASREAALYFYHCTQRPDAKGSRKKSKTPTPRSTKQWPLLWPVEAYPQSGHTDLSCNEDTTASAHHVRSLACYESLALFLACTALPVVQRAPSVADDAENDAEALVGVWQQLEDLWLAPALLLHEGEVPPRTTALSTPPLATGLVNYPPFAEDSLLTLLCALALCILIRPSAEYEAWLSPGVAQQRLRPLRRLCVARRGVDPVYFMVRYITSGKGRKRLPAILLDGCEAELTVETVIDVSDFTEGEDLPGGEVALSVSEDAVNELLTASFLAVKSMAKNSPTQNDCAGADGRSGSSGEKDLLLWPSEVMTLARTLLGHKHALRTTPTALQQLLASRTVSEWTEFMQHDERALALSKVLGTSHPAVLAILRGAHVDVVYLASLCVAGWLWPPATHLTSARRKLCWAALQYFSHHGIAAYDGYVARNLAAHVERVYHENLSGVSEAVIFPQSRALPLPSSLFVLLLVRPFTLAVA
ncbi:hypothetical protein ABB37_01816 [Leptomonas pyrrhocoris]|uniref:Uncharacterized protein n=1 Tax=Leptomonas pyrrhocoris TaxID=157538 RepID=A0A0M9G9R3_LEPPY|nr:hypothetical protein ABB37_01816 [Leptomonas pyrrhocoris]KPA85546.1 hypothetical protein ABB37_01816 [Leptomonas pyrrhocoris]|eukprot:XP_015663985.1 hypothetical protein ABB37_01816 [Leptomonas pyrrhocoris]